MDEPEKYNKPKMKIAMRELQKRVVGIFDKYEVLKSDRSIIHNSIRGIGMIKQRIAKK